MIKPPSSIPKSTHDYYRSLLNARRQLFNSQGRPQLAVSMLERTYSQTIQAIQHDFKSDIITKQRAEALTKQIKARLNQMNSNFDSIIGNQQRRAMHIAVQAHKRGTISAYKNANKTMGIQIAWDRVPQKALEAMNIKRGLSTHYDFRTLMRRRITDMQKEVDTFMQTVVARGVAADRASAELATMMGSRDPQTQAVLKRNANIKLDRNALNKAFTNGDLNQGDYKQLQSLMYDARRIVISEVNTGFREANTIAAYNSPVVGYLKWDTSSIHSHFDVCDIYAEDDQFDLGPGIYPIGNFPASAHPFCACYGESVLRRPKDWNKPTPPAQKPPILEYSQFEGKFNTKNELHRQVDIANEWNRKAYQYAKDTGLSIN